MTVRNELLASIATTTVEYREGDLAAPTPEQVDRWVTQFDAAVQLPSQREMDRVQEMTWRQVASSTYDRDVNPADGASEPKAWRKGAWCIKVPTRTANMKISVKACSPGPYLELIPRGLRPGLEQWGNESAEDYAPSWPTYGRHHRSKRPLATGRNRT